MTQVALCPVFNDTIFLDNGGLPLANGLIFTYAAGGFTSEQATYTDSTGTVANTNPIVLDASGRMQTEMWLEDGLVYNFSLTLPNGSTVLKTFENVSGSVAITAGGGVGTVIWNPIGVTPIYISATQFYVTGDFTTQFVVGNRVRWQYADATYGFGVVTSVTLSTGKTYVTVAVDSTTLSSTITNVAWSSLVVTNYTVDAGAVGYTSTFTYSGANIGAQLQATNTTLAAYQRSYSAILTDTNYDVTTDFNPTVYDNMVLDVIFDFAVGGPVTINVNNIGQVSLLQFDNSGTLVDPVMADGWCSRIMYNGTAMVVLENLPYTAPPPVPVSFAPTSGTVNIGDTFTVTAGGTGKIAITVSNYAHALFGNFGEVYFTLTANGTEVARAYTRFFEWDSRTGGGNPTLVAVIDAGAGVTTSFQVHYVGAGTYTNPSTWLAVTA